MSSLVEEIQREAIDDSVPVSVLLRKVKLAAFKLGLDSVENWVTAELDGYEDDPPDYRIMRGTVKYNNGYASWQTLLSDTSKFSMKATGQSVPQIEAMLQGDKNAEFLIQYSDKICRMLDEACGGMRAVYGLMIDRSQLMSVLAAVRGQILDWAINLERAGIKGEGMTFSKQEKQTAEQGSTSIHIGTIGSMNGNLGAGNSIDSLAVGDNSVDSARSVVSQLRANADALASASSDSAHFLDRLERLERHLAEPKADPSFVKAALNDLRAALSGAAGNLIASGAVSLLNGVLGTGIPTP
ncbi:hypothetical protein FQV39_03390 [Bosea sp. F3-2]|uniref:AbiTii domain-containing protein n=1 Tax=Bosea sp. F3-2 TaxID=2599640 RepID=UPI0011EDD632|nr:hypothetical protein [Bosea sp. F3-2]QEL21726.1 hypothetical protein FQV39_03390 [Bosea sp. F3-2]